jgi:hypothetical protein
VLKLQFWLESVAAFLLLSLSQPKLFRSLIDFQLLDVLMLFKKPFVLQFGLSWLNLSLLAQFLPQNYRFPQVRELGNMKLY